MPPSLDCEYYPRNTPSRTCCSGFRHWRGLEASRRISPPSVPWPRRRPRRIRNRREFWYALADVRGEGVASIGFFGALGDPSARAQLLEGIALIETADAVHVLRKITGENQAVAQ